MWPRFCHQEQKIQNVQNEKNANLRFSGKKAAAEQAEADANTPEPTPNGAPAAPEAARTGPDLRHTQLATEQAQGQHHTHLLPSSSQDLASWRSHKKKENKGKDC